MTRNKFTAPKQPGPDGRRRDLRTHCEVFKMTACDENDQRFLSHLYRCIFLEGGMVTINTPSGSEAYRFGE